MNRLILKDSSNTRPVSSVITVWVVEVTTDDADAARMLPPLQPRTSFRSFALRGLPFVNER